MSAYAKAEYLGPMTPDKHDYDNIKREIAAFEFVAWVLADMRDREIDSKCKAMLAMAFKYFNDAIERKARLKVFRPVSDSPGGES